MSLEETLANNSKMLGEILGVMKHLQSLQERGFEGHLRLVETVQRISLKQDQRMTEAEDTALRLSAEQDAKLIRLEGVVERLAKLVEAFVRASGWAGIPREMTW